MRESNVGSAQPAPTVKKDKTGQQQIQEKQNILTIVSRKTRLVNNGIEKNKAG